MSVGIDFGTSKVCVAVHHDNQALVLRNEYGERTTPCYVGFGDKEIYIGETVEKNNLQFMENTVYQMKRLIGRTPGDKEIENDVKRWEFNVDDQSLKIGVKFCSPHQRFYGAEEISSLLLRKMIKLAENNLPHKVTEAFISVPACFNDRQRSSIAEAGLIAGLESVHLVNETTAASLAYNHNRQDKKAQTVLIFDLGAGSFDLSVCVLDGSNVEVLATRGNSHFGGDDLCVRMTEYCMKKFEETHKVDLAENKKAKRRLYSECEKAKRKLSFNKEASVHVDNLVEEKSFQIYITRKKFENMNKEFFMKIEKPVGDIIRDVEEKQGRFRNSTTRIVKEAVLVGGSTRIPKVREILTDVFTLELKKTVNPDEAVALGAALTRSYKIKEFQSTNNEIAVYPLNIEVANWLSVTKSNGKTINVKRASVGELISEDKKCRKVLIAKNDLEDEIRTEKRKYKSMDCSEEIRKLLLDNCDAMLEELEKVKELKRVSKLRCKLQRLWSTVITQSISYPKQTRDKLNTGGVDEEQQQLNIYGIEENIDALNTLHSQTDGIRTQNEHRKTEQDYEINIENHKQVQGTCQSAKRHFSKESVHRQQISKRETSNAAAHSNDNKNQIIYERARIENDDTKSREAHQIYLEFENAEKLHKKQEKNKQGIRTEDVNESLLQIKNTLSEQTEDQQSKREESEKVQKSSNKDAIDKGTRREQKGRSAGGMRDEDLKQFGLAKNTGKKVIKGEQKKHSPKNMRAAGAGSSDASLTQGAKLQRGTKPKRPKQCEKTSSTIAKDKSSNSRSKTGCLSCSKRSSTSSIQGTSTNLEQEKTKRLGNLHEYEKYINERMNSRTCSRMTDKMKKSFRTAERDINKAKDVHEIGKVLERVRKTCKKQAKHWNIPLTREISVEK